MTYNIICIQRMQRRYGITINYQFRRNYSSVNQTAEENYVESYEEDFNCSEAKDITKS